MEKKRCRRCDALCIPSDEGMCPACHDQLDGIGGGLTQRQIDEVNLEVDRQLEEKWLGSADDAWDDD